MCTGMHSIRGAQIPLLGSCVEDESKMKIFIENKTKMLHEYLCLSHRSFQ